MAFGSNLAQRFRLLRTALGRRFIWHDMTAMVKQHGFELRDVRGNIHPLKFARQFYEGLPVPPAFAQRIGPATEFALATTYAWNSEPSVSEFLGELAFYQRARTVVELGCYVGWTSAHLAAALEANGAHGRLWCVDFDARFLSAAQSNLARLGLAASVEFIHGMSDDAAVVAQLPAEIDLLFIDTSHEYEPTLNEIALYAPRLSRNGRIVLHDSISQNGVRRAVDTVGDGYQTHTFATEYGNGVTVLTPRDDTRAGEDLTNGSAQNRPFRKE